MEGLPIGTGGIPKESTPDVWLGIQVRITVIEPAHLKDAIALAIKSASNA